VNRKERRAAQGAGSPEAHALLLQGVEAHQAGRLDDAEAIYRRVLAKAPKNADALHLAGVVAHQSGRHARAADLIGKAIALNDAVAQYHANRGHALMALERAAEAARAFERAAALAPGDPAPLANLGQARLRAGDAEGAADALDRATKTAPNEPELHFMHAAFLMASDRAPAAVSAARAGLALAADDARGHGILAGALEDSAAPAAEVEAAYRRALTLDPAMADIWSDLGNFLRAQGRDAESIACFDSALAAAPDRADTAVNRGLALLALGRFAEGWRACAVRRSIAPYRDRLTQTPLPADLSGRRILLHRDQGLGDEIFFLRFTPELKRRGAWIAYRSQSKIAGMIGRLDFLDQVIDEGKAAHRAKPPPGIDMEISVSDLPMMLGMQDGEAPPPSIALPCAPGLEDEMRAILQAAGPPPWIGLTWRAGQQKRNRLSKVAPLEGMAAALKPHPATLVALQRAPEPGEIDRLAALTGRKVADATALNDDLERMLALVGLLDDYICVSNTNVHLRWARGSPSRVLVPLPADYRWMAAGAESPWFPGSPVYREDPAVGWEPALAALAGDLARG
jgi:Tfp pilus assembly protein PilF